MLEAIGRGDPSPSQRRKKPIKKEVKRARMSGKTSPTPHTTPSAHPSPPLDRHGREGATDEHYHNSESPKETK